MSEERQTTGNKTLPIAVQLYSLREFPGSFQEMLDRVAAMGYPAVELVHNHGLGAEAMREALARAGLRVVSAHVSFQAVTEETEAVIAFHRAIDNPAVILPSLPRPVMEARTPEAWQEMGRRLDELGQRFREAGLRLGYHNHAPEMTTIQGKRAIDWLLESADPEHLFFEPDLAWVVQGGADPVALLAQYAGRCPRVHVKDIAPLGQNQDEDGWADVGYGVLDWDRLLPAAKAAGAEWYVVEHDKPRDPLGSVARSLAFLRQKAELL